MYNDKITLVRKDLNGTDSFGDRVMTETTKSVWCRTASIGMREFYEASTTGFKPEIRFVIRDSADFNDAEFVEYKGVRYRIIRTFVNGRNIELTCSKDVNNGGS